MGNKQKERLLFVLMGGQVYSRLAGKASGFVWVGGIEFSCFFSYGVEVDISSGLYLSRSCSDWLGKLVWYFSHPLLWLV